MVICNLHMRLSAFTCGFNKKRLQLLLIVKVAIFAQQ